MSKNSSNLFYLGVFLCVVCAAAAGIMGSAAVLTREPIEGAKVNQGLRKPDDDEDEGDEAGETEETPDGKGEES